MRLRRATVITAAAAGAVVAAVFAAMAAAHVAGPAGTDPAAPDTARTHDAGSPDPSYWTPERLRNARPAPMPGDPGPAPADGSVPPRPGDDPKD